MRITSLAGASVAGLAVLLSVGSSGATNAAPRGTFAGPGTRAYQGAARRASLRPRPNAAIPHPCVSDYPGDSNNDSSSFDGMDGFSGNVVGGVDSGVLGGGDDLACDDYSAIGAGHNNGIGNGDTATESFIGAGIFNAIEGPEAFIGAGTENEVTALQAFVGAGDGNSVTATQSFLGGGAKNVVSGMEAFLGGGYSNNIEASANFATIVGGNANVAVGSYDAIGGGYANLASGTDAMIPGGQRNEAEGELSFAGGYQARALHSGSFVWSDFVSSSSPLADTGANEFVVRASGGTYVYSNESDTAGVKLAAGSGAWANLSDRNAKTDIVPLDDASILAKVTALPIDAWRYKTEAGVRHVGPMAQDFYAAFGVGEDDRHITSIDEDGVALAAIKSLNRKVERKDREIDALRAELRRFETAYARDRRAGKQ